MHCRGYFEERSRWERDLKRGVGRVQRPLKSNKNFLGEKNGVINSIIYILDEGYCLSSIETMNNSHNFYSFYYFYL